MTLSGLKSDGMPAIPGSPGRAAVFPRQPPQPPLAGNRQTSGTVQVQIRIVDDQGNVIEERVIEQPAEDTRALFDEPTN